LKQIKRKDINLLINACDAAREGELIFRRIVEHSKSKLEIKRLWLQSMTAESIREGFRNLKSDSELIPLANAAQSRSEADWLIGINGTRAFTAFNSQDGGFYKTPVGRVKTPTLAMVVEREKQISSFVSKPFQELNVVFKTKNSAYVGKWFDPEFKKDKNNPEFRAERIWDKFFSRKIQEAIKDKKVEGWTALKAREAGIETVFQDRALCPQQSIVWNIFMGKELTYPFGFIREKEQIREANRLIREIGFTSKLINAESPVGNLSGGERQGVAIARAIYNNAELIILDEPTNALSLNETQKVFDFVNNVKKSNRSVLFIGHNIFHVYDISDRFVVLDRGEIVHQLNKSEISSPEKLMKIMKDTISKH